MFPYLDDSALFVPLSTESTSWMFTTTVRANTAIGKIVFRFFQGIYQAKRTFFPFGAVRQCPPMSANVRRMRHWEFFWKEGIFITVGCNVHSPCRATVARPRWHGRATTGWVDY